MIHSLVPTGLSRAARALTLAVMCSSIGACDDTAQMAREITEAQGDCTQDSLRVSSEACVDMFEKYAEMATGVMHTYIGGLKAMDQALKRLPPPNFDTAGLGRAFTYGPDSTLLDSARVGGRYLYGTREDRYGPDGARPYAPDGRGWPMIPGAAAPYEVDPADPAPSLGTAPVGPPITQPGVLLPPEIRLRRPWIEEEEPQPAPIENDYEYPYR